MGSESATFWSGPALTNGGELVPGNNATLSVNRKSGDSTTYALILRLDTPDEVTFYWHGGILPYVYRKLIDPKEGR